MARVYAIASAKGGVGKTTTTANLGATLADTGAAVVVIDGDIGMANLGAALGVSPTGPTLHDVLAGEVEPQRAAYEGPAGLTVIPGDTSLDSFAAADPQRLDRVVEAFDDADFILIDVGAGVSHETSIPLSVSDAVVLVSTPERDALVDTEKTRQLTERLGGVVAGAVITRTDEATPIEEVVSGTLTANVLTTIPDDEAVRESVAVGEPLISYAPHSEAAAGYRELARQLTGRTPNPPEPSPSELAAETRDALEASDDQLADSLSESGITIDPTDTSGLQPSEPGEQTEPSEQAEQAEQSAPAASAEPSEPADSDETHNVVNPFAATPEDETPPSEATPSEATPESESKWAEAATGTMGDEAEPVQDDPAGDAPDEGASESVPSDAIPFGSDNSSGSESESSADDETTETTTVLGAAVENDDPTAATDTERGDPDTNNEKTQSDSDEPLIPDAEETAAANTAVDDAEPDAEISVDETGDDETDEKRGFFSRLFR